MNYELETAYFFVTLLVGVFSIGQCSIILIRYWGNRVVRAYLLFIGLISIKVFTWLILSYLQLFKIQLERPTLITMISELSITISLWALPRFIHAYFKVPFGRKLNYLFLAIVIVFGASSISGLHEDSPISWLFYDISVFSYIYLATIVYSTVIAFIYYRKLEDKMMRSAGLAIGVILAIFSPAFLVDFLFYYFVSSFTILSPLFYITWNLLAFYFTIRYHLVGREQGDRRTAEESHLPSEEFYNDYNISSREQEILQFILQGHSNQEVADLAFISLSTVKTHVYNIYRKVGVKNRLQLLARIREINNPD